MKTLILSLMLVVFSASAGTVIIIQWLDTVETIEKNIIETYVEVPDLEAAESSEEDVRAQLMTDIRNRLALLQGQSGTEGTVVDIVRAEEKKSALNERSTMQSNGDVVETADADDANRQGNIVSIAVPFTSQAPYGDWSYPWQDACEEASVIMAHAYFKGVTLSPSYVQNEILKIIEYEKESLGYYNDTNIADTALFARTQYGLKTRIVDNATVDLIRVELDAGNIVIAPMAGRLLPNPYFTPPGPLYHMVVIIGYDDVNNQFVTNDPGTRNGKNLRYTYNSLMYALHDWTGDMSTIQNGASRVLVIENEDTSS